MTDTPGALAESVAPEVRPGAGSAVGGAGSARPRAARAYLPLLPFFLYVGLFLLLPTAIVVVGAFQTADGGFTLANIDAVLGAPARLDTYVRSIQLSVITAVAGALFGALLAWAVAGGKPDGALRQFVVAASGVLAQFGGVMLAFAFLATFGLEGLATIFLKNSLGIDTGNGTWLYTLAGLAVVYTYFQIPLMLIVFLPAVEGLRREWSEASATLGGGTWAYWRYIGGPILAPTFLGAVLLLFTNAFSAYATAAALVSQGSPLVTLQIRNALTSEVLLGQENVGKALALGMIVIIAIVMAVYTLVQRRAAKWLA